MSFNVQCFKTFSEPFILTMDNHKQNQKYKQKTKSVDLQLVHSGLCLHIIGKLSPDALQKITRITSKLTIPLQSSELYREITGRDIRYKLYQIALLFTFKRGALQTFLAKYPQIGFRQNTHMGHTVHQFSHSICVTCMQRRKHIQTQKFVFRYCSFLDFFNK